MIVDAHVHVHPDADGMGPGCDARLENLLRTMDDCSVEKAVIMAEAVEVPYVKRIDNAFVARSAQQHVGRLIPVASVHPAEEDAAEELVRCLDELNMQGLKLHPRFQGIPADDERVVRLANLAAERGAPVFVDAMLWKPTPLALQLPLRIDALAKAAPEARIVMSHAGGFRFLDALAVVVANDNVYLETSAILDYFLDTPFEAQFLFVLKQAGASRVLYGSDFPQKAMEQCLLNARRAAEAIDWRDADLEYFLGKTGLSLLAGG
jgi:hypothetical protein